MFRRIAILWIMLLSAALLGKVPAAAAVWNLSNDFSTFANPNGVWAFGSKTFLSAGLSLYNDTGRIPAAYRSGQLAGWSDRGLDVVPYVLKNVSGTDWVFNGTGQGGGRAVLPPRDVLLHPSSGSNRFSAVQWTAPRSGLFTIDVEFERFEQVEGANCNYFVLRNGQELPGGSGVLVGFISSASRARYINPSLFLNAGETLGFVVGFGLDGTSNADGTIVRATVRDAGFPPAEAAGIAVFRPSTREWLLRGPEGSATVVRFGEPGDLPVPADYQGTGRAQIAVFRPSTREWFLRRADGSATIFPFGEPGDVPVHGDYFGLGRAQIAVYRPSAGVWLLRRDDGSAVTIQFGGPGDIPVPGDYFGLRRSQIAVYRPGTGQWFLRLDNGSVSLIPLGQPGDVPAPGDYFGLGRLQLAVYRPGTGEWLLRDDRGPFRSVQVEQLGGPSDVPVPGDYLGLGRAQIAVYRPGTGDWFIRKDDGTTLRIPWGGPGDVPVALLPGDFSPDGGSVATFFESFDRGFSQSWTTSEDALPIESLFPFRPNTVFYGGGQGVTFTTLDGAGVAILGIQNVPNWCRFGYVSLNRLTGTAGEIEARINTLTQGGLVIDGLFDLWLVNSRDHSKYVRVGLFGDRGDTLRSWTYSSSLTSYSTSEFTTQSLPALAYRNNTWYRVRITQSPGQSLEVSIWDDAGSTRLASHRFPHTLADLGSTFQIGFSQWMGGPHLTNSLLVAIDSISGWLAR